jgi:hypothetical protein
MVMFPWRDLTVYRMRWSCLRCAAILLRLQDEDFQTFWVRSRKQNPGDVDWITQADFIWGEVMRTIVSRSRGSQWRWFR